MLPRIEFGAVSCSAVSYFLPISRPGSARFGLPNVTPHLMVNRLKTRLQIFLRTPILGANDTVKMPVIMITDGLADAFRTERLVYRAIENNEEDRHFLHTQISNDPVNTALSDPNIIRPRSIKHAEWMTEELSKSVLAMMICLRQDVDHGDGAGPEPASDDGQPRTPPRPIGFVALGWGGMPATQAQHRCVGVSISLAAPYQDKGYGGEAINWVVDWAFRFGGYHRVNIGTVGYNERAQHLYRRLGFIEEGRSRESHWHDRKWYDGISYGMLEHEWAALRGLQD